MKVEYKCTNSDCNMVDKILVKHIAMAHMGEIVLCDSCKEEMQRVWASPSIKTSDGYKS